MDSNKKYYAFISYKREDKKEAERLQHALEYYHLPNHLRQDNSNLPEYVRPIFRDITDLEVGELSSQIHTALEQSHYLIIVCSPRAAVSKWVNDEIKYYISLGNKHDKIIPYIIEGVPHAKNTPEECYPPVLLKLSQEKELLGANINETGRESATIRVVSRMFNIRFDTLYQRYQREQKRKRRVWISGSILVALLGLSIGGYFLRQNGIIERQNERLQQDSTTMANHLQRISSQNDSISSQNNLIISQRDSIEHSMQQLQLTNRLLEKERDNVSRANWNLKQSNAKILSDNALRLLETGNTVEAQTVISHICRDDDAKYIVQMPKVELSLRKIYRELTREGFKQMYSLDYLGEISHVKFDMTGNKFYIISHNSLITEYEASMGTVNAVYTVYPNIDDNSNVELYAFDEINGNVYYSIDSTLVIKNIYSDSDNGVSMQFHNDIDDIIVSPSFDHIACELARHQGTQNNYDWHLIRPFDKSPNDFIIPRCKNIYCFSPDGQNVLADIAGIYCIYNVYTRNIERRISYSHHIRDAHFSKDGSYIYIIRGENYSTETVDVYDITSDAFVEFGKQITGNISTLEENPQQDRIVVGDFDGNLKIYETDYLTLYNIVKNKIRINAHLIETLTGHSESIRTIVFNTCGTKMLSVSNGKVCMWNVILDESKYLYHASHIAKSERNHMNLGDWQAQLTDTLKDRSIGDSLFENGSNFNSKYKIKIISRGKLMVATKDSLVYVIRPNKNQSFTIPFNCPEYSLKLSIDQWGEKLALWNDQRGNKKNYSLQIYDLNNNTMLTHNESLYCAAIAMSPQGKEIAISTGSDIIISCSNTLATKLVFPKKHKGYICSICYSPDGKYIISASWDRTVCLWDTQSGSLVKTFRGAERELQNCSMSFDGNYILATTKNTTYIWSVQTGEIVEQLESEDKLAFCQDIPNKMYFNRGNDTYYLDFPSIGELISFFKK